MFEQENLNTLEPRRSPDTTWMPSTSLCMTTTSRSTLNQVKGSAASRPRERSMRTILAVSRTWLITTSSSMGTSVFSKCSSSTASTPAAPSHPEVFSAVPQNTSFGGCSGFASEDMVRPLRGG
jgi:hypothetical protein